MKGELEGEDGFQIQRNEAVWREWTFGMVYTEKGIRDVKFLSTLDVAPRVC